MLGSEAAKGGGKAKSGCKAGAKKTPEVWPLPLAPRAASLRSKKQQSSRELHEEMEERRGSLWAKTKALQKKKKLQQLVGAATVARLFQEVWQPQPCQQ